MRFFKNNKSKIIIFLIIACVLLFILKVLIATKQITPETTSVLPSPTNYPSPNFTLNTTVISPTRTADDIKTEEFYKNLEKATYKEFPLFDFVPYRTTDYTLDYTKPLVLQVVLKKDTLEIRQEVLDWILSKGVYPKTHTIIWKTQ